MKSRDKTVMLVVAFVAVIAIVGVSTFNRYETKKKSEQAKVEKTEEKIEQKELVENVQSANTDKVEAEIEIIKEEVPKENEAEKKEEHTFSEKETIIWPIDGDVILNYSMDQTIHFPTLDQYKYNPALVIAGEEGQPVLSAADGTVKKIYNNAQTGTTVAVDLGSGYEAIYGQLEEMRVTEGQRLAAEDVIGYVAKPTKYYSVEGTNLYFQMLKDGEPVNPLEYMEE